MPTLIERPKMSLAMWAALKSHIMRQREKKKQEQEADAAIERLRREQEMKQKQNAMTLEEIKDQVAKLSHKLIQLKDEKHQLFLQLKKVLNEDETRRKVQEANDLAAMAHGFQQQAIPFGPSPVYLSGAINARSANSMYKVTAPPQNVIPQSAMKRPRSPSPPPTGYQQNYNYKVQVTSYGQKPSTFHGNQGPTFFTHPPSATPPSGGPPSQATPTPYPGFGTPHPTGQYPQEQGGSTKHLPPQGYHLPHLQQQAPGYVTSLQQPLEHSSQKPGFSEEKYVQQSGVVSMRGVQLAGIPSGQQVIPIQQQPKPGGITAGYPVRAQPPPPSSVAHYQSQHGFPSTQNVSRHNFSNQPTTRYY
ncbi:uncharacterized protein LOC143235844 [Tachypleus tridentatus]|uniref:uncharacterized protein LOC143235844 n=1 Tax=Tachypleus tridentatus TaxID=6853 RepID=UPI003FD4A522